MEKRIPVYDLKDFEEKLNIRSRTLREYIKQGKLKGKKVDKAYYVTESNLMDFLNPE